MSIVRTGRFHWTIFLRKSVWVIGWKAKRMSKLSRSEFISAMNDKRPSYSEVMEREQRRRAMENEVNPNGLLLSSATIDEMIFEKSHPKPSIEEAVDAANLAITEYYNGDRAWAERWLLKAYEANQTK